MTSGGGGNTVKRRSSQHAKQKTVKTAVLYTPAVGGGIDEQIAARVGAHEVLPSLGGGSWQSKKNG